MADSVIDLASLDGGEQTPDTGQGQQPAVDSTPEFQPVNQGSQQAETPEVLAGKAVRDAVRELSTANPAHAKLLKQLADTHFREATAWKKAFETPQQATEAKSIIEAAGGIEGISQATTRLQGYDQQDVALKEGNPEVLDAMFKDFPEGAAALAPHYLERLAQVNPAKYAEAVGPHAVQMLVQAGVGTHLDAILAETDPRRQAAMIGQLNDWFKGQIRNATQAMQGAKPAAGQDKMKARETELDQREQKIFIDSALSHSRSVAMPQVTATVDQYARQYKLDDNQKAHYRKTLENAVVEEMNADPTYKQQMDLRLANKNRTAETVGGYAAAEFARRCKDRAFDVAKSIYGSPRGGNATPQPGTGQPKAGQPQTAPGGGPLRISGRPPDSMHDTSRPDYELNLIKGRVHLKTGQFVTWR